MTGMLPRGNTYREVYDAFRWRIPERYNIARDVCERHAADPNKIALIHESSRRNCSRDYLSGA